LLQFSIHPISFQEIADFEKLAEITHGLNHSSQQGHRQMVFQILQCQATTFRPSSVALKPPGFAKPSGTF
jgi:hypothetical protein